MWVVVNIILNIRCCITIGIQKVTIILTTTHGKDDFLSRSMMGNAHHSESQAWDGCFGGFCQIVQKLIPVLPVCWFGTYPTCGTPESAGTQA